MVAKITTQIYLILFISLHSYSQTSIENTVASRYTTAEFDAAIFPETSQEIFPGKSKFTPTKKDVDKAEMALKMQLKELNSDKQNQYDTPVIDKNLKKYKRQYFGYIDEKGERVIYINFFWRKEKEESMLWLKEQVKVLDGGSYFWNVKYKLDKNELYDLEVNGNG